MWRHFCYICFKRISKCKFGSDPLMVKLVNPNGVELAKKSEQGVGLKNCVHFTLVGRLFEEELHNPLLPEVWLPDLTTRLG